MVNGGEKCAGGREMRVASFSQVKFAGRAAPLQIINGNFHHKEHEGHEAKKAGGSIFLLGGQERRRSIGDPAAYSAIMWHSRNGECRMMNAEGRRNGARGKAQETPLPCRERAGVRVAGTISRMLSSLRQTLRVISLSPLRHETSTSRR